MGRTRWSGMFAGLVLAACGGATESPPPSDGATTEQALDSAAIAALPVLTVDTGVVVCTADGYTDCPLRASWANGLGDGRIALWEPGRRVLVIDRDGALTPVGDSANPHNISAITAGGAGFRTVVVEPTGWYQVELDAAGRERKRETLPAANPRHVPGFVGRMAVAQRYVGLSDTGGASLRLEKLEQIADSAGSLILEAPVPWLREVDGVTMPAPLFAGLPVYTLDPSGAVAWTPAERFAVEFRDARGRTAWRLTGPDGPPITEQEYTTREGLAREFFATTPFTDEDYARMRAEAPARHAPVTALVVEPDGTVYIGGPVSSLTETVDWIRVAPDGTPNGRFALGLRTRVLLARGDSLLVHQPTAGEPWEVRWVRVGSSQ
jgi:hypothetical protein